MSNYRTLDDCNGHAVSRGCGPNRDEAGYSLEIVPSVYISFSESELYKMIAAIDIVADMDVYKDGGLDEDDNRFCSYKRTTVGCILNRYHTGSHVDEDGLTIG